MPISKEELKKLIGKKIVIPASPFYSPADYEFSPVIIKEVGENWVYLETKNPESKYREVIMDINEIKQIWILKE
jgi:hypothetical protein